MKCLLQLIGCDDTTSVYLECTEDEYEFLRRVCYRVHCASQYHCMPKARVLRDGEQGYELPMEEHDE